MTNRKTSLLQDQWSSKLGFILAATGAAVGLGNIWRFPYMAGKNGGSAFVILYIIFVILIGLPIMISEFLIGRHARQNPVDALANTAAENKHSRKWGMLGWWGALGLLLVLSFYSVVSGWCIAYFLKSIFGTFTAMNTTQVTETWEHFLANPLQMIGYHTLFMCLTMGIIAAGVQQGLEKSTKLMMPALYLILFILVSVAAYRGNFNQAVNFLFAFHFEKITPAVVIAALGHAFFTLALGAGALLMYGAYIPKGIKLVNSVFIIAGLDVLVALLSGLAIFPIVFQFHLPPQSGPGLMFVTLPISFAQMHYGGIIGGLFFLLLIFAAWTSSINIAEPLIVIAMNRLKLKRLHAAILIGAVCWILGIGSVLSFNVWQHVTLFNHYTIFDIATNFPTDIILPIGGIGFALFAGWIMPRKTTELAINTRPSVYCSWRFLIRYLAPLGVLYVFIATLF